jgi:hypothetical protein
MVTTRGSRPFGVSHPIGNDRRTGEMLNEEVIAASVKAKKNYKVFERWLSRSSRRRGCGLVGDSLDSGIDYAIAVC